MRRVTSAGLSLIAALVAGLVTACNDSPTEVPMPRTTAAPAHIPVSFATASTPSGATFTTDKDDYLPGDTLKLAGSGWQSGDSLDIHMEVDPQSHSPLDWTVGIDENGGFRDSSYVVQDIDIGVTFYLTATSRVTGESATATFTDGNISIKSNKPGVTFVVTATKYTGSGTCTSGSGVTETTTTPTIDAGGTNFSANPASGGNPAESYKFVAAANSDQGAGFQNWTTTDAVVSNSGNTLCVAGFNGNPRSYTANYNANPDLTISKSASGAFAVGASGGTYQITVSNTTGTASARGSAGVTVKDTLPSGLTFSSSSGSGWQACTASGQIVTCDLANGQSIDPGGTKTVNLLVNVATSACPTVTNRAWVSAGDEPAGNKGNNGSGDVATSISTGCPSANTPPSVDAGGPYTVAEGTQLTLSPTVSDPDAGDVLSYKWSIAYTTAIDLNGSCSFDDDTQKNAKITCDDDSNGGTFTLTLEVKDGAGGHTVSDNADLTVTNANPTAVAGGPYSGNEGSAITLNGTGDDPGNNDDAHLTYKWSISTTGIDAGGTCSFDDDTKSDAKVTCTDDSNGGTFDLSLVVKDDDNGTSTTSHATLSVANVDPTANAGGPYSGNEGAAIQLSGSGDDVGSNDVGDLTYKWTVNTSGIDPSGACTFDDDTKKDAKVTCTDDSGAGTFTLSLTVKDDDNGTSTASTASLTVSNVAPTMSITAPGDYSVWAINAPEFGSAGFAAATFSDVGKNDTHTCKINWGDGDAEVAGVVTETAGSGTGSCASAAGNPYTDDGAGIYLITVTIADDDGGQVSASRTIIVYDPSAGFVTGGGWISSPSGAYFADPSLTGRANFGFVSKYLKGNNVPTGNTEFQFQAGNLNFHSDTYEWLVVNQNGLNAQFKGNGLINGQSCSADREGKCRFMLWAYDGTKNGGYDTFRIEIWTEDSGGVKHDVYDNGGSGSGGFSNTAINGGSIQVQTGKK